MTAFYAFIVGVLLAWPIALLHGIDIERRRSAR